MANTGNGSNRCCCTRQVIVASQTALYLCPLAWLFRAFYMHTLREREDWGLLGLLWNQLPDY